MCWKCTPAKGVFLTGKLTVAQAASKYKIKDSSIYTWRSEVVERLPLLFEMKAPEQEGVERIAELERMKVAL